jgi:hypothetical protein
MRKTFRCLRGVQSLRQGVETYPFDATAQALARQKEGRVRGKLVVDVREANVARRGGMTITISFQSQFWAGCANDNYPPRIAYPAEIHVRSSPRGNFFQFPCCEI